MQWTFHEGDLDSADVGDLLTEHFAAMRAQSPAESCHVLPVDRLRDPAITFWSLREQRRLLGVGALQQLDLHHGEIKSMRTMADAMGRGVGRAVLHHIVAEARARGYRRLSLETGSTPPFVPAIRLYESAGFQPCGPFGSYRDTAFTRFFMLELD